jgi:Flp pilus assembly pilin Flp
MHEYVRQLEADREQSPRDAGASLVEYALLVSLTIVAIIAAVNFLGDNSESRYDSRWGSCGGVDQYDDYGSGGSAVPACP